MRWFTHSLATKLTVCVVGSMALLFGLYGYWNLRIWRQSQQEMVFQSADRTSDTICRSIRYSMLRNEREEVFHIINTIGHETGISRIRIFKRKAKSLFPLTVRSGPVSSTRRRRPVTPATRRRSRSRGCTGRTGCAFTRPATARGFWG